MDCVLEFSFVSLYMYVHGKIDAQAWKFYWNVELRENQMVFPHWFGNFSLCASSPFPLCTCVCVYKLCCLTRDKPTYVRGKTPPRLSVWKNDFSQSYSCSVCGGHFYRFQCSVASNLQPFLWPDFKPLQSSGKIDNI